MANTYLSRTPSSTGNRKTWTFSTWIKRGDVHSTYQTLFSGYVDANNFTRILFWDDQRLTVNGKDGGSFPIDLRISNQQNDTSGWYHIVVAFDTTQATDTNRIKIYINGEQKTSFEGTATYPSQNYDTFVNHTNLQVLGQTGDSTNYFEGAMTHIQLVDGTALTPSEFGETDTTSGIWTIKTGNYATPGTNGFSLKGESSANLGLDSSSSSNNLTVSGNASQLKDNPDISYNTFNENQRLAGANPAVIYSGKGWKSPSGSQGVTGLNFMPQTGKWYFEFYFDSEDGNRGVNYGMVNLETFDNFRTGVGGNADTTGFYGIQNREASDDARNQENGSDGSLTSLPALAAGDYAMIAIDMDNRKMFIGKNGTWSNSGNPTAGTGNVVTFTSDADYMYTVGGSSNSARPVQYYNFGDGCFGNTALTGTTYSDGDSQGTFKYTVPTGFYCMNTKSINTRG